MCGIAGLISQELKDYSIEIYTEKLLKALQHRGPDDSGSWVDLDAGLLMTHNRLAIHDLSSAGAQPMHSTSGQYCVVFNGEIYNYLELQSDLLSSGHVFHSDSDTEVLLAAIEEWGLLESVRKFSGMFAFALWDKTAKTLHLCRDRLGEKPLYYGWLDNCFYFASELHAIESISKSGSLKVNLYALNNYLKYGYISAPHSIYAGIYKLPQACILTLPQRQIAAKNHDIKPYAYWSLLDSANYGLNNQITDFDEAVTRIDTELRRIIKRQLLADVDVGLFLSGGIDSSTVSAIAQHVSTTKIKTFTIGFNEKEYDESVYAEMIARHLHTDHTTLYLSTAEAKDIIPGLSKIYDEPFADSSQIPAFMVSRLARQHVTVCLSGDGGDELFAGYNRYFMTSRIWDKIGGVPYLFRKFLSIILEKTPTNIRNHIISAFYKNNQGSIQYKIQKLIDLLKSPSILYAYDGLSAYWPHPSLVIKDDVKTNMDKITLPNTTDFLAQAMYIDQIRYLEGDNLAKTDRASMAVNLETRLPLLSHEMVELAWRIPSHMKVTHNTSKWVLRNVLYKYVPEKLTNRPKMGFSVPIATWLRRELRDWAEDLLSSVKTGNDEHLESSSIMSTWHEHQSGKYDHANRLWTILMFIDWRNHRNI